MLLLVYSASIITRFLSEGIISVKIDNSLLYTGSYKHDAYVIFISPDNT